MKNIGIKIIILVIVLIMISFIISNSVYAVTDVVDNVDKYVPQRDSGQNTKTVEMGKKIIGIITNIGIVVSVISIMVLGVKYILGSVEEKAKYKETAIPILIGIGMLAAACSIVGIIYNFATNL